MKNLTFEKNAKYAFTLESEVKKNLKLFPGEKEIYRGRVRLYQRIIQRICYLVLTNKRLFLLKHYVLRPDRVISVAWNDVQEVKLMKLPFLYNKPITRRVGKYIHILYKIRDKIYTLRLYTYSGYYSKHWYQTSKKTVKLFKKIQEILKP